MTISIVDFFEMVNIQQDRSQRRMVAARPLKLLLALLKQAAAVGNPGNLIDSRQALNLRIQPGVFDRDGSLIRKSLEPERMLLVIKIRSETDQIDKTHQPPFYDNGR